MTTRGSYLVQINEPEYEDPDYRINIVRKGHVEWWFDTAILVDADTRDRWDKACKDWEQMQAELHSIVDQNNHFHWRAPRNLR